MELAKILKKQGGMKLLKQYWNNGSLFTAVSQFLLLGKSRTSLEILRLSVQLKEKQKLGRKYKNRLEIFDKSYDEKLIHNSSDKVWVCWFQGMENAPLIVKKCYQSIKKNMSDKEVILLTNDNLNQYVKFPDFILDKWQKGIITDTHMTDLLRLELLIKYGGMWIDATVFCTSDKIPAYFFNSDLFLYQCLKPGRDGHSTYISSWLMSAKSNNKVLMATRYLCYEYWKKNNKMINYFLLHNFLSMSLEYYDQDWKKIVPRDNATPHILLLRLFDKYDEKIWQSLKEQSCFHKLTYKFTQEQTSKKGTFFEILINNL